MKHIEYPTTYIVWDLETSGFDPNENELLEIGLLVVENGNIITTKRWVLNHNIEIPERITEINGMTKAIIDAEGKDPKECLFEFLNYVRASKANLTHNGVKFDIPFFLGTLKKILGVDDEKYAKIKKHLEMGSIDTAMMYKSHITNNSRYWNESFYEFASRVGSIIVRGKYNLGICCDELGIDRSKITQHRALGDVELTNEIYKKLIN